MKIERLSENQIRCTLYKNDLIDHEIKLSELAYGTDKAKNFFKEMMTQASYELGFEANDIPLIIEAVPVSSECIILLITKVEDPEELDTRFSRFSPTPVDMLSEEEDADTFDEVKYTRADDILDLFNRLSKDIASKMKASSDAKTSEDASDLIDVQEDEEHLEASEETNQRQLLQKVFSFSSLSNVTTFAESVDGLYNGTNTLYKNPVTEYYYLTMNIDNHTPEVFNQTCNMATEYGQSESFNYGTIAYYEEHYTVIIRDKALQILSSL